MALSKGFLHHAERLIRAQTVSPQGTRAAADLLQPLYEHAGLEVRRQIVVEDGVEQINLLAGPGGLSSLEGDDPAPTRRQNGLLLVTHLDTVPPGPLERWTETGQDPWALTEREGFLYGLGVADVKLDALCKAEAARRVQGKRFARPFWLLGTFGEEVGLRGARHFAQSELFAEVKPRWVLCGEPSELQIIHAHKGYAVVRCTVTDERARLVSTAGPGTEELTFSGKAAHSSTPHLGINAIRKALAYAKSSGAAVLSVRGGTSSNVVPARCVLEVPTPRPAATPGEAQPDSQRFLPAQPARPNLWRTLATVSALEELWHELLGALVPAQDARFDPPGALGNLNVLESAEAPVPEASAIYGTASVAATLDARLLPQHDPDALLALFAERAQAWVLQLGRGDLKLQIEVTRNASGMALPDGAELVRRAGAVLQQAGRDGAPRAKPTSTEAGIFARAGCEAIVFGPGRSTGNAHTANERIEMAQLEQACDLYQSLLLELCGS